jgi:nitrite reductase/ring-hydroxylating ferredoxin subunit
MKVVVARVADFAPGERRIVEIGRRSIGVFRVGERFYAINNHCPHQGGPLCLGRTAPWMTSDAPGVYRMSGDDTLIVCPWHGWEYELASGQSFMPPDHAPVRGYGVRVEPGRELGDATPPGPSGGRVPGPYLAETFQVSVEDDYVVVDTGATARRAGAAAGEGDR